MSVLTLASTPEDDESVARIMTFMRRLMASTR